MLCDHSVAYIEFERGLSDGDHYSWRSGKNPKWTMMSDRRSWRNLDRSTEDGEKTFSVCGEIWGRVEVEDCASKFTELMRYS